MFAKSTNQTIVRASLLAVLSAISVSASAQDIVLPSVPQGMTAEQIQSSSPAGASFVIGTPTGDTKSSDKKALIYRDPSKPLTIGEMSEIQKKKDAETFLRKAGFTSEKPPVPKAQPRQKAIERVQSEVSIIAVYAREGMEPWGEVKAPNGSLMKVIAGTRISNRVTVQGVTGKHVSLVVAPDSKTCKPGKKKSRAKQVCDGGTATTSALKVGEVFRWVD